MNGRPPRSPLFPSPPLCRSEPAGVVPAADGVVPAAPLDHVAAGRAISAGGAGAVAPQFGRDADAGVDRKSTRLNSSHANISYAVFCLKQIKLLSCLVRLISS